MPLSPDACIAAIEQHSAALAEAARDHLDVPVEHCPGWDVADLVWHLTEVHWFWATIAEERSCSPPDPERRPARPHHDELLERFTSGARRLVDVLARADQGAPCWTWAPLQHDVAFITRHQVQEAAVHHWDVAHGGDAQWSMDPGVAADAVTEFLTFSLSTEADPAEPPREPLGGRFALHATDTGDVWTLTDGTAPGTVRPDEPDEPDEAARVEAPAADLLLWLYGRVVVDTTVPSDLLARFRNLTFTD